MNAPKCLTCKTRDASYDGESQGFSSNCERCAMLLSGAPRCPNRACLDQHRVAPKTDVVVNAAVVTTPIVEADVLYRCDRCATTRTLDEWMAEAGRITGELDLANTELPWLVGVRREVQLKAMAYSPRRTHASTFAYARAYLAATEPTPAPSPERHAELRKLLNLS